MGESVSRLYSYWNGKSEDGYTDGYNFHIADECPNIMGKGHASYEELASDIERYCDRCLGTPKSRLLCRMFALAIAKTEMEIDEIDLDQIPTGILQSYTISMGLIASCMAKIEKQFKGGVRVAKNILDTCDADCNGVLLTISNKMRSLNESIEKYDIVCDGVVYHTRVWSRGGGHFFECEYIDYDCYDESNFHEELSDSAAAHSDNDAAHSDNDIKNKLLLRDKNNEEKHDKKDHPACIIGKPVFKSDTQIPIKYFEDGKVTSPHDISQDKLSGDNKDKSEGYVKMPKLKRDNFVTKNSDIIKGAIMGSAVTVVFVAICVKIFGIV